MGRKVTSKRVKINGRTYRATLDNFLAERQLVRKPIAKDGSCLFRAVSEQVYDSQCHHYRVRLKCAEYIDAHRDDFKEFITMSVDKYMALLLKELWGGEVELVVLSRLYGRSIVVYNELRDRKEVQEQVFPSSDTQVAIDRLTNPILLAFSDSNHYDGVFSRQYMEDTAFCQGILYTILMNKVFKQHISYLCKKKLSTLQESDINLIVKHSSGQERDSASAREGGRQQGNRDKVLFGLSRFSPEILRAMSWTLHHNAALLLHRWEKNDVEQRDRHMAASIQFRVGNRCYFYIDGKRMNGEIAALNAKSGIHLVNVHDERWEIPVKELTLYSSHSTPKQGKPGEQLVRSNFRTPNDKDTRHQHKDRPSPATTDASSSMQSILGAPPTSSSVPSGSIRKGKAKLQSRECGQAEQEIGQVEHAQKKGFAKHRSGNTTSHETPAEAAPQQQEHSRTKSNQSKNDHVRSSTSEVLSVSATRSLQQATSPNPAKTAYSSVVKKTAGGPSGSLTSEGTEYDESSGDEEAQDDSKEEVHTPESSSFTTPHSQQRHQGDDGQKADGNATDNSGVLKPPGAKLIAPADFIRGTSVSGVQGFVMPADDSPYLDPQIPRGVPSQPQDAWPEIPQMVPPQNTMIYAAVMTNRSNQDQQESPIVSSSTLTAFPFSTAKTHYSGPLHRVPSCVSSPSVTFSPQTASAGLCLSQTLPQSSSVGDHSNLGLNSAELGYTLPAGSQHPPVHTHLQYHSSTSPTAKSYGMVDPTTLSNHTRGEVYSSTRAGNRLQMINYNASRSPRMDEAMTTNHLQGAAGTSFPYHAITTVAAGMEMRSMLGIEGRQYCSRPMYVESSSFQTTMSTGPAHQEGPVTTNDKWVQTEKPACSGKEIQVGVEQITRSVQTMKPSRQTSETQTQGWFVPAEELMPIQDIPMESIADQLSFAVKYSLQCLQALSQTTGGENQAEATLKELLDNNHIEQLVEQAAQTSNLTAPQLNFLRSIGSPGDAAMQFNDGQPPLISQSAEFSRNEDVAPQQEHHLPSPGVPQLNMPPHGYPWILPPFMMPSPPQRMYHIMPPHMPIPLPMGFSHMMPPPMMPQQMPMPPVSPDTEVRVEEEGEEVSSYPQPDTAHQQDLLVQGGECSVAQMDNGSPQQIQPVQPSEATSSEVKPSYSTPATVQTTILPISEAKGVELSGDLLEGTDLQQQQDTQSKKTSELALPTVDKRDSTDTLMKTTTEAPVPKTLPVQPVHSSSQTITSPKVKNQKSSRKSSHLNGRNAHESPTVENNQPGLPCRPSVSNHGGSRYQQPRSNWRKSKGQGSGDSQRRIGNKSDSALTVGAHSSKKLDVDEKNSFSDRGKKELGSSSKKTYRSSTHRHSAGQPGTPAASSNQDPTRNFADRTRSHSDNSATSMDTKDFKWNIPSPGEVVLDSPFANTSSECKPESEVTEWPDWSEMGASSKQQQTFSASLKFVNNPQPVHQQQQPAAAASRMPNPSYDVSNTLDFMDDPFPAPTGIWEQDSLTISPSQNFYLGQQPGRYHKH